jgi:hypothetical protein
VDILRAMGHRNARNAVTVVPRVLGNFNQTYDDIPAPFFDFDYFPYVSRNSRYGVTDTKEEKKDVREQ